MTDEIAVCPECDDTHVYQRQQKGVGRVASDNYEWRCDGCGARFDDPDYRAPKHDGWIPGDSPARALLDADPDEVGL